MMEGWNSRVFNFLNGGHGSKPIGEELRLAMTISVQFRMVYTALWYSVDGNAETYCQPAFANLVDLSDPARVVVMVPVKLRPYFQRLMPQPVPATTRGAVGVWPMIDRASFADDPMYIRFTFNDQMSWPD
jgi:hypothetical protein